MQNLEQRIKDFVRSLGVQVVGIAGPDRLDGPPSLDPTYIMPGARSAVVMAVPMDVPAIYQFLSKESSTPHNIDQKRMDQVMYWTGTRLADYLVSLGHRAQVVPTNSDYRRSPDLFATHPSFSFRFGAIAAGIAASGWSGNVMTKEYGAAIYLSAVVTDAELESDTPLPPRHFIDNYCTKCRGCEKTCPVGMFEAKGEEYILIAGELHPRGKRRSIDLCNISCFGLHALSRDKKWSTWGRYWIDEWVDQEPDPKNWVKMRMTMMKAGQRTGTAYLRYELIRRMAAIRWPEEYHLALPAPDKMPADEAERLRLQKEYSNKLGVDGLDDYNVLTCGQCALVCGPTVDESLNRLHMLTESGLVVPGPDGKMVRVDTYEEACEIRRKHPYKPGAGQRIKDNLMSAWQWPLLYGGIQPKSIYQGVVYDRKLRRAVRDKIKGYKPGES
jgi:epoxyqueuosine reductase QueG